MLQLVVDIALGATRYSVELAPRLDTLGPIFYNLYMLTVGYIANRLLTQSPKITPIFGESTRNSIPNRLFKLLTRVQISLGTHNKVCLFFF
jgi:hypothetical protein